jgi:hypothetical protein
LKESSSTQKADSTVTAAPAAWSDEKIRETTAKIAVMMHKGIKKQMKWQVSMEPPTSSNPLSTCIHADPIPMQPSCKTGKTKWSYTTVVPHPTVMQKILKLDDDDGKKNKAWKQRKIPRENLLGSIGFVSASCRYNDLRITSEMINVKWEEDTKMLSLSGTYGI